MQSLQPLLRFSLLTALVALLVGNATTAEETAIDRYIQAADDSYSWNIVSKTDGPGFTTFVLDMTSQTWRTTDDVNRTEWQHWIKVVVPDKVVSSTSFVMVTGGANGRSAPKGADQRFVKLAQLTGTVVAELNMIPNQPLIFHGDGENRTEDNLIGYTWTQFIKTKDPTWLARAPMTKSVVRTMDTITALMATDQAGKQTVDKFVIAGASKRGWTTWITGAMDKRVVAIAPIVIDVLNTQQSMQHHFAAYGFWAPAIGDYVRHRVTQHIGDPKYDDIYRLVDPISYRERLTMPKYVLNAAGDQFFLPDSSQFYWDELLGSKSLRYVPNADHGMDGSDAFESLLAFYWLIVNDKPIPELKWSLEEDEWKVTASVPPKEVRHWYATNPIARDFRKETFGANYQSSVLTADSDGSYSVSIDTPPEGWTASLIEATFDVGGPTPLKLTTNIHITPDELPFAEKDPRLEPSLTVTCEAQDDQKAIDAITAVKELVTAGAVKAPSLSTERFGKRVYFNWRPPLVEFEPAAKALTKLLSDKGCSKFAYQLESGLGATIAPGLQQNVASP